MGKTAFWSSNHERLSKVFFLLILFLPTQLGRHFFFPFSYVDGIRIDYLSPTIYLTDIFIVWFLLLCFSHSKFRDFFLSCFEQHVLFFSFLVLVLALNIITSPLSLLSLYTVVKISAFILLGFSLTWYLKTMKESTRLLLQAFSLGMLVESFLAILQFVHRGSLNGVWYFLGERSFTALTPGIATVSFKGELFLRPYATFPHPNVLAAYLLVGITLLLFSDKLSRSRILVIGLSIVALLLTASRLVLFCLLILFVVYLITQKKTQSKKSLISSFTIALILFAFFLTRFNPTTFFGESYTTRVYLAKEALQMFFSNPILGRGLGLFIHTLPGVTALTPFLSLQPVHTIFLLVAAETGLIGLSILVIFFYWSIKRVSIVKDKIVSLLVLSFFLFLGCGDHYFFTLQQGQLLTVLIFSIIFSSSTHEVSKGRVSLNSQPTKNTRKQKIRSST